MSVWADMKVRTKLMTLVIGCCAGLVFVGSLALVNLSRLNRDEAALRDGMKQTALLQDIKNHFLAMRLDLVYLLSLKDAVKTEEKEKDFRSQSESLLSKVKIYEKCDIDATESEQIKSFRRDYEDYAAEGEKLAGMTKAAQSSQDLKALEDSIAYATNKVGPLYAKPAQTISTMVAANIEEGETTYQQGSENYQRIKHILLAVIVGVVLLALVAGSLIANAVSRPIRSILKTLMEVAQGNLASRTEVSSKDELGMVAREVNGTAEKLNQILSMVAINSEQVASAAAELHSTAAQMASGAESMVSQAGTVATASEEMSATSSDIAQSCHNAASGAHQSSKTAEAGASVVEHTVQVMNRIADRVMDTAKAVKNLGDRSVQIGAIIATIEDIADQTNLLALNAAIEAARAGDQGRGFAVVADEVRALAERTTSATREIGEMIKVIQGETGAAVRTMEEGVKEVESGTVEAAKSGAALQAILEQINAVSVQVSQIATAAEEQTATTGEISNNIGQINQVVQHTAHGAHESVIAANKLSQLAEDLQKLVGQFNL